MAHLKLVLLVAMLALAWAKVGTSNNEDALTPEDVEAFRTIHADDT